MVVVVVGYSFVRVLFFFLLGQISIYSIDLWFNGFSLADVLWILFIGTKCLIIGIFLLSMFL